MAHFDFNKDIKDGERGEKILIDYFTKKGYDFIIDNKDSQFDFILRKQSNHNYTAFEIKTDVLITKEKDTGNMFIEFKSRGKDSGINTTKANFFITYFPHIKEIWICDMNKLKTLISNNDFRIVSGGDNGTSKGYLIPRIKYKGHFKVLNINYEW